MHAVIEAIRIVLDTRPWNEETCAAIASILRERGCAIRDPRLKLDETDDGRPITAIGHSFIPRDPPNAHQCRLCGWPARNHI